MKPKTFARFAWLTLGYNVIVIIWGVFLRASKSGDGCGQHWLTCKGELIPTAPELKTIIEFTHRIMSGVDFFLVLALFIVAFIYYSKGDIVRKFAAISFLFMITEALVGAGLVLTGNTAESTNATRPLWAIGHLINTFILLAALTLTAFYANNKRKLDFSHGKKLWFALATIGLLLIGSSGVLAALSSMLFPSATLVEGIRQDLSQTANALVRLRISHPILSVLISVGVLFYVAWIKRIRQTDRKLSRFASIFSVLILVQVAFGAATLLSLGPILMQLGHLFLADMVWIFFVLFTATFYSSTSNDYDARPVLSESEY